MWKTYQQSLPQQRLMSYLAVYILFVSSSTFLVFGRDKLRAKQAKSRISERALLLWIAC